MILGTVCARGGSKGIPGKNIRIMADKPLIYHTLIQAQAYPFDSVVVSTDSDDIAYYCRPWPNTEVQMRPAELATDTASKWDVFRYIAEQNGLKPDDILVDLDIGCPLRIADDISACVSELGAGFDVVATAYESDRNPYFNMVEIVEGLYYVVNGNEIVTRRQDAPEVWSLSPAVFAIRVSALNEYYHWSAVSRMGIVVIPRERAWDIDTQLDFEIVEYLMKRKMR